MTENRVLNERQQLHPVSIPNNLMTHRPFALVMAAFLAFAAHGAEPVKTFDPAEGRCKFSDDEQIGSKLMSTLDYANQVLPNIPPEEERYLKAESDAAQKVYRQEMEQNNWKSQVGGQGQRRFGALAQRPLYDVWELRNRLAELRAEFENILQASNDGAGLAYRKVPEAAKLSRATHSLLALNSYTLTLGQFLAKQERGRFQVISSEQYDRLYSGALMLPVNLHNYMDCKLARVVGRQPF